MGQNNDNDNSNSIKRAIGSADGLSVGKFINVLIDYRPTYLKKILQRNVMMQAGVDVTDSIAYSLT